MSGTRFSLEVQPTLPAELDRLGELAEDLYYSWDQRTRRLFASLDGPLWELCLHNPGVFLRRVSQERLQEAVADRAYMEDFHVVLSAYDAYRAQSTDESITRRLDPGIERIAFFCAEFGFHESLPVYSGGLGILAADYCKAASDLGMPFVAVGLLYRQGSLSQRIDADGNQVVHYVPMPTSDLPIVAARNEHGDELCVSISLPEREVKIKVWRARAGRIDLILLDTDVEANDAADRAITQQLYTSDVVTRLQQAMVLGIGGVRALDAVGLMPTIWHINEGLPALQIVERCRRHVARGLDFESAMEVVAASTVFTTHTPVPAGHEVIDTSHLIHHMSDAIAELGVDIERFLDLGRGDEHHRFNFTTLCLRGSRFHNGVSRIHGGVASEIEKRLWREVPAEENPISYVTNGVHVQTFLAMEWMRAFDDPEWPHRLLNPEYWDRIDDIPDDTYWQIHRGLKAKLLQDVRGRLRVQSHHRGCSEAEIAHQLRRLDGAEDALVLGFARRFATYKRATLLFNDPDRLERLLSDPERPVIIIIAGKAHQADEPGKDLIRQIHRYSEQPEFRGKVILLEGYDLSLGRSMIRGVDVWLNLPEYPLEACGTSGQKAGINGVLNLSVLDGWWPEGFNGENGWAIEPHNLPHDGSERNRREANELFELLEEEVVPMFFRNGKKPSSEWIRMSKASMKSLLPRFNSERMVVDYVDKFYGASCRNRRRLIEDDYHGARELAGWKKRVAECWNRVTIRSLEAAPASIGHGEEFTLRVAVDLGALTPGDVIVECLLGTQPANAKFEQIACFPLLATEQTTDKGEITFQTAFAPPLTGLQHYTIRVYPYHRLLSHPFELGLMKWL